MLFAGFAILFKDMAEFLAAKGYEDGSVEAFRMAFNNALERERFYLRAFFPEALANLSALAGIPHGITEKAERENFHIERLCEKELVKEWNRFLGWAFFREYSFVLRENITGALADDVPDEGQNTQEKVVELAGKLIGTAAPDEYYWYPLILFLSLLLYRTDFSTVPEAN